MSALESIINQKLKEFKSQKEDVSGLKRRLKELKDLIQTSDASGNDTYSMTKLQSEMTQIKQQIQRAEHVTEPEADYLMKVGYLLYKIETENPDVSNEMQHDKDFYGCSVTVEKHKGYAFKKYMADVENNPEFQEKLQHDIMYKNHNTVETCKRCASQDLIYMRDQTVCKQCGVVLCEYLSCSNEIKNNMTYEQQINDVVAVYSYNRMNHMNEWISKLQAREMTVIPTEVLDAIRLELKKARITQPSEITQKRVKELLKKLKMSKYYEHVPNITNVLTGVEVQKFPIHLEHKLRAMFEQIQEPFRMFCPKTRKNFLHYGYVLYKFCELLGEDSYLKHIPMLKSFEKLYVQDQIWKKICAHLRWEFIPSV